MSVHNFRSLMNETAFTGVGKAIKLQQLQSLVAEFPDYTQLLLRAMSPESEGNRP